ncbi:cobalt-precorrin-3B C(17)-methyltransferase [Oxobacter pfennigii]|uniref:Cobalt-precorrin-3B C(17)-methyltransferase n=1 Tax=Oxobacter pfennigii TaxID=36849 RepID=A0A0P8WS64_9CLOT|nr:precorrin-3B C(17)-methyltransferase [Oxobacter pfennigii]KPU45411.1 cobalt-precorrin-3B C(17)-methyltransferase [Oxobacter pfennigii]
MAKLYVIGIGPGGRGDMTIRAYETIKKCPVIVGYNYYIDILGDLTEGKKIVKTGMRSEVERCKMAVEQAKEGYDTCMISTGDSGLYGMAGPILELADGIEVEIIPGVTSSFAAASELGAPIMHDFCTISLSDLLTPWEVIEKRLEHAAAADFVIALYNPKSKGREGHLKKAIDIVMKYKKSQTPVGAVKNAGREGNERRIFNLETIDYDFVDMKTIVIIGNNSTYIKDNFIITPRGYMI